ncbi:hypothetical protein, partial [uncultured Nostoc sp.]|uniref:hypothetical protein n=1 Tax=uncultured Nostoc sp. TaxID=340711 RepID=UPI0035CA69E7
GGKIFCLTFFSKIGNWGGRTGFWVLGENNNSALSTQNPVLRTQHSVLSTQNPALSTQYSEPSTQHS